MRDRIGELFAPFRAMGLESLVDVAWWLVLTVLGGLMPLWGGYLVLRAFSQEIGPFTFVENGEFALYSAAILSATIFEVSKELGGNAADFIKSKNKSEQLPHLTRVTFPYHRGLNILSIALIVVSAIAFAIVAIAGIPRSTLALDESFFQSLTIALFVASILIGVLVTALGRPFISQMELKHRSDKSGARLEEEYEALEEGH